MQKWSYVTASVYDDKVLEIDGQKVGDMRFKGFSWEVKGENLHDFLNRMGQDGWEVVGVTPVTGTGDKPGTVSIKVILKRPIA